MNVTLFPRLGGHKPIARGSIVFSSVRTSTLLPPAGVSSCRAGLHRSSRRTYRALGMPWVVRRSTGSRLISTRHTPLTPASFVQYLCMQMKTFAILLNSVFRLPPENGRKEPDINPVWQTVVYVWRLFFVKLHTECAPGSNQSVCAPFFLSVPCCVSVMFIPRLKRLECMNRAHESEGMRYMSSLTNTAEMFLVQRILGCRSRRSEPIPKLLSTMESILKRQRYLAAR
jgi:hypothetical protein